jgi:hypothetical protein
MIAFTLASTALAASSPLVHPSSISHSSEWQSWMMDKGGAFAAGGVFVLFIFFVIFRFMVMPAINAVKDAITEARTTARESQQERVSRAQHDLELAKVHATTAVALEHATSSTERIQVGNQQTAALLNQMMERFIAAHLSPPPQ